MRHLLILGAGTAGTMTANRLRRRLDPTTSGGSPSSIAMTGTLSAGIAVRPLPRSEPGAPRPLPACATVGRRRLPRRRGRQSGRTREVSLVGGQHLRYDYLVIATGTSRGPTRRRAWSDSVAQSIHDFYTLDGAERAAGSARMVRRRPARGARHRDADQVPRRAAGVRVPGRRVPEAAGLRDRVELVYVTPLSGAFTKPVAATRLGRMLDEREDRGRARLHGRAHRRRADDARVLRRARGAVRPARHGPAEHGRRLRRPAPASATSSTTSPSTRTRFMSRAHDNVFALGDATDLPTSKAGSVAHFSVDVFVDNFVELVAGRPHDAAASTGTRTASSSRGDGKALLIDFNYDVEPLPGITRSRGRAAAAARGDPR